MRATRRGETGQLSVFVAILTVALVLVAGLVADGGGVLAAHQQAIDEAFEAARAGAQALDADALRARGTVAVDPEGARTAAIGYLGALGHSGVVTVSGDRVTVTVRFVHRLAVLSAAGLRPVEVAGTATVRATTGAGG